MSFVYRGNRRWLQTHPTLGDGDGLTYGFALIPGPFRTLTVIFSDGEGWEHVSVSTPGRPPNWAEMCHIKDLFWDAEDTVMQFHPARSAYINNHPHCLHLWRPNGGAQMPVPPAFLVGVPSS